LFAKRAQTDGVDEEAGGQASGDEEAVAPVPASAATSKSKKQKPSKMDATEKDKKGAPASVPATSKSEKQRKSDKKKRKAEKAEKKAEKEKKKAEKHRHHRNGASQPDGANKHGSASDKRKSQRGRHGSDGHDEQSNKAGKRRTRKSSPEPTDPTVLKRKALATKNQNSALAGIVEESDRANKGRMKCDENWEAHTSIFGFVPTASRIAFDISAGCIEGLSLVSADEETGVVTDLAGIEEEDLPQTLIALGFEIPADIVMEAVARSDEDESGTMEYEEFVALLTALHQDGAFVSVSEEAELVLVDAQVVDRKLKARAVVAAQREKESQDQLAREKEAQDAKNAHKAKMKAHLDRVKKANSKLKVGMPTRAEAVGLKIEAEFKKYDTDSGGTMDTSELGSAVGALGIDTTPERLQEIVASVDADGSGTIDLAEFRDMLKVLKKDIMREAPAKKVSTGERMTKKLAHDHTANKVLVKMRQSNPVDRIRRFMLKSTKAGKNYVKRIAVEEQGQIRAERLRRQTEDAETDAQSAAATKAAATAKRRGKGDRMAKMQAKKADTRKRHKAEKSLGHLT
jgi:Ca2+-binding EF-hand superfamily protein